MLNEGVLPWKGLKDVQIIKKVFISNKRPVLFTPTAPPVDTTDNSAIAMLAADEQVIAELIGMYMCFILYISICIC